MVSQFLSAEAIMAGPVVVIIGPTASGKSALALELAEKFNGEIIAADSRTIYQGLDVGTAKPTIQERQRVAHWGVDLLTANQNYSIRQFKYYAEAAIRDIHSRGKVPFLVGGSGLYIDAVLFNYQFADGQKDGPAIDLSLVRVTNRQQKVVSRLSQPPASSLITGLAVPKQELRQRIKARLSSMLEDGVVDEALRVAELYGWNSPGLTGNIYPLVRRYSDGELSKNQFLQAAETLDWRLAKRQLTWFRRNPYIVWSKASDAKVLVGRHLAG